MKLLEENIADCVKTLQALGALGPELERASRLVLRCLKGGNRLLVCGNGGSAADASHLATEFVVRFMNERRPYPAISLVESGSTLLAIGNDYSFDQVFARQVQAFGQSGDVLIAFTTSGQSPNVLRALEQAASMSLESITFLGRSGGACKGKATVELIVPVQSTARIQEAHQVLFHTLCQRIDEELAGHV